MRYTDIRKHIYEEGDFVIFYNGEQPAESLKANVLEVRDDTKESVSLLLLVMESTPEGTYLAGNKFWYELDRTGNPTVGTVLSKHSPTSKNTDDLNISVEDAGMFHLMVYLKPLAQRGKGARYEACIEWLKLKDVLAKDITYKAGVKMLKRIMAAFPDKLSTPGGGWLYLQSSVGASRSSVDNFTSTDRVVDKEKLVKAVSTFVVDLFESGALGPMSWKLD